MHKPFRFNTSELPRRAGEMREYQLEINLEQPIGIDVIEVPSGILRLNLRIESVDEGVLASGKFETSAKGECIRCLDPISIPISKSFQELYAYKSERDAKHKNENKNEIKSEDQDDELLMDGDFIDLDAHLTRFLNSCVGWRIPLKYTKEDLEAILKVLYVKVASTCTDCLVWIAVTRGVPSSGNPRDLASCKPNFYAYFKPYFGFNKDNEATVCLARNRRRVPDVSINQKHKNFAWNDLNLAQWEAIDRGYDTAILLNRYNYITEGPGFNVGFISKDNFVYAPRSNCLRGTTMELVRELCEKNEKQFFYADIDPYTAYKDMDAMFLTSTAGNVIRVSKYENTVYEENEMLTWLMKSF